WGLRVAASSHAKFHLLLSGDAVFTVDDGDEVALVAGDLVLLAHGTGHVLRDKRTSRLRHLDRILNERPVDRTGTLHYGGRGAKSLLLCGAFELDSTRELLASLPTVLVLDTATNGLGRWLDPMIDLVRNEVHGKPGDAAVVARVADVFLTDVLREYLAAA